MSHIFFTFFRFSQRSMHINWIVSASVVAVCGLGGIVTRPSFAQQITPSTPVRSLNESVIYAQASQTRLQTPITVQFKEVSLEVALTSIAKQSGVRIGFGKEVYQSSKRVTLDVDSVSVERVLKAVLEGTGLVYRLTGPDAVVIEPKARQARDTTGVIAGRVFDSVTQKGMAGVTVTVVGTSLSVITRENGIFTLPGVPIGEQTLSVRFLGYHSKVVQVVVKSGGSSAITIPLQQTTTHLSEVVTTATGQQRRLEVGNDIVKIDAGKVIERAPVRSVTDLLMHAQVPGVQVIPNSGDPGAPARIRMRGIGSITQNNDPAVIVDGIWISASTSSDEIRNQASTSSSEVNLVPSRLDDIDPQSIESIEIIRGPSAATLYGQEAANGVIVITTKRGQVGSTRWNFNYSRDWNDLPRAKAPLWKGYGTVWLSDNVVDCNWDGIITSSCTQDSVVNIAADNAFITDEGKGYTNKYGLSVSGGTAQITYALRASALEELGAKRLSRVNQVRLDKLSIPIEQKFIQPKLLKDQGVGMNLMFHLTPSLNLGISLNGNQNNLRQNEVGFYMFPFIDSRDTMVTAFPQGEVYKYERGSKSSNLFLSTNAAWTPNPIWRGQIQGGIQQTSRRDGQTTIPRTCSFGTCEVSEKGQLRAYQQDATVYTGRLSMSSSPRIKGLNRFVEFRPGFGIDIRKNLSSSVILTGSNLSPGSSTISGQNAIVSGDVKDINSATAGWYINSGIRVLNRLFFDVGLRQDVGSAIQVSSSARYPKLSTSWIVSDEPFFPKNDWISIFRLRFALGHAAIHPEVVDIHGRFVNGEQYINGQWVQAFDLYGIGNSRLVPERSIELETGFDIDIWKERFQLNVTFANKDTRNAIIERSLATSAGVANQRRKENIANVVNRSLEFGFTGRIIDNASMGWTVTAQMNGLTNQVAKVGDRVSLATGSGARIVEGYPINGLWKRPVLGYGDANQDGHIDATEVVIGDTAIYIGWGMPRFTASYGTQMSILQRRLTVSAQFSYKGTYIQTLTNYDNLGFESQYAPLSEQALARLMRIDNGIQNPVTELRFNSASISLILPQRVTEALHVRLAQLTIQASNLGLWTRYRGRDPGVNSIPVGNSIRDDGNVTPLPRTYAIACRLDF